MFYMCCVKKIKDYFRNFFCDGIVMFDFYWINYIYDKKRCFDGLYVRLGIEKGIVLCFFLR